MLNAPLDVREDRTVRQISEKFVALPGRDSRVIEQKYSGAVVVGEGKFNNVFLSVFEVGSGVHEFECDQSPLGVGGFGFHDIAINCPHRSWNKKRIYGELTYGLYGRKNGAAFGFAYFYAVDFPSNIGVGGLSGKTRCIREEESGEADEY